jgi:quercetin dioxygenase-like cupin family protein
VVEFEDYIRHPGQEFAVVLSGKVRIQFENGDSVVLGKLETAYFDSSIGHVYLSLSKKPAEVLAVCSDTDEVPSRLKAS